MWNTVTWLAVLLSLTCGNVMTIDNGVHVSTVNPAYNVTRAVGRDGVIGDVGEVLPIPDEDDANVIVTTHGSVRGYEMKDAEILQFFDIPYAAFDERNPFQAPSNPVPWENVREMKEHNSSCPQLDSDDSYTGTPDCLTLSVFIPKGANNADVLFHIHDGGFIRGSGDPLVYGPNYIVPQNVILILPNYRLGPLGFLCLRNSTAPGNAALRDLTMALNWTRQNIEAFGGNPLNIVVSGSGTGAALAQYLAVAPNSRDYVNKVITESGCILSHWAIDRNPIETANVLARNLNASQTEIDIDSNNIFNTSLQRIITGAKGLIFRPCVERTGFFTETPWNLLNYLQLNKTFMFGAVDRPGLHKAMHHTEESISALNEDFGLLLPNDLTFEQREEERETGKRVKVQYFGNNTISLEHRNELSLCHSDCSYLSPGIRSARLLVAAKSTVYLYEFSYVDDTEKDKYGAGQGDSLNYVFQRNPYAPVENTKEYEMINLMTGLWVSFIQMGKPTSAGVEWEELQRANESEEAWLSIGNTTELKKGFHLDRLSLWTEIYNEHFIERNGASQLTISACFILLIGSIQNYK